jgi:xylan 1,4-beta-xylosidase
VSPGSSARIAWFEELGAQTERNRPADTPALAAPERVVATSGRGHVTLDWGAVDGAVGYVVHRAVAAGGPWQAIDHKAGDLLAVPHPPYTDTTGEGGVAAWYAVAALPSIDASVGPLSEPAEGRPRTDGEARVSIAIDAATDVGPVERPWRPIIGSEHLALLLQGEGPGGHHVGD